MNITQDDSRASEGYLLLADISGYTAFLTGTELEPEGPLPARIASEVQRDLVKCFPATP